MHSESSQAGTVTGISTTGIIEPDSFVTILWQQTNPICVDIAILVPAMHVLYISI